MDADGQVEDSLQEDGPRRGKAGAYAVPEHGAQAEQKGGKGNCRKELCPEEHPQVVPRRHGVGGRQHLPDALDGPGEVSQPQEPICEKQVCPVKDQGKDNRKRKHGQKLRPDGLQVSSLRGLYEEQGPFLPLAHQHGEGKDQERRQKEHVRQREVRRQENPLGVGRREQGSLQMGVDRRRPLNVPVREGVRIPEEGRGSHDLSLLVDPLQVIVVMGHRRHLGEDRVDQALLAVKVGQVGEIAPLRVQVRILL